MVQSNCCGEKGSDSQLCSNGKVKRIADSVGRMKEREEAGMMPLFLV